jgi:membrane protein YqaA with SNARE-associated domain
MNMLNALQLARNAAGRKRGLRAFRWLGQWGALGIFAVAVVDFSIIPLPLPNGTDLLLLWLVSHGENPWILVPSALVGGIVGSCTTWHLGSKSGRPVLRHYRSLLFLDPIFQWIERHPIPAAFLFPLLPPPIPLTPFVLASGATGIPPGRFFPAFSVGLSLRYVLVAWLGKTYGRHVVSLWAWALRKCSGPLLWIFAAMLVGVVVWSAVQAISRKRSTLSSEQPAETL